MRILFVENDPTSACWLAACADGIREINVVHTAAEAVARLASGHRYSAVVIDWILDDADGLDVARGLRAFGDDVPIVMTSAAGGDHFGSLAETAKGLGRATAIQKPWTLEEIAVACRAAGAVPTKG